MTIETRWRPNQAGFFNFWFFKDDLFEFINGKLHLMGENMSGKSVTTQSLITILLDGKKDATRMDTFGSRSRTLRDTFLGSTGDKDQQERNNQDKLGYTYLEYKRGIYDEYITTGMGLQAKAGHQDLDYWFFIILDNSRIGKRSQDIKLYKEERIDGEVKKIPLSKEELREQLGEGGKIYTTNAEYMKAVNDHLFQFREIQIFEHLIKLLIALRSNKLGGGQKPKMVYEILTDSLPSLSLEELSPLSNTIESIDTIERELTELQFAYDYIEVITSVYEAYHEVYLAEIANGYLKAENRLQNLYERQRYNSNQLSSTRSNVVKLTGDISYLEAKEKTLNERIEALRSKEAKDLSIQKGRLENQKVDITRLIKPKQEQKKSKEIKIKEMAQLSETTSSNSLKWINHMKDELSEMEHCALDSSFKQHSRHKGHFMTHYEYFDYDFSLWNQDIQSYQTFIHDLQKQIFDLEKLGQKKTILIDEKNGATVLLNQKQDELHTIRKKLDELKKTLGNEMDEWLEDNEILVMSEEEKEQLLKRLYHFPNSVTERELTGMIEQQYSDVKRKINDEFHQVGRLEEELVQKQSSIEEELNEWIAGKMPIPFLSKEKEAVLESIKEWNIPHILFYDAVEFQEGLSEREMAAIESALEDTRLLTTVIADPKWDKQLSQYTTVPNKQGTPYMCNLTQYLKPSKKSGKLAVWVEELLSYVGISKEEECFILSNGNFKNGMIKGQSLLKDSPQYLGEKIQVHYKKQIMSSLENKLNEIAHELEKLQQEKNDLFLQLDLLDDEYHNLPDRNGILELNQALNRNEQSIKDIFQTKLDSVREKLTTLQNEMDTMTRRIQAEADFTEIPLTSEAFSQVRDEMHHYDRHLNQMKLAYTELKSIQQSMDSYNIQKQSLLEDVDNLSVEISSHENELQNIEVQINVIIEEMERSGLLDNERQIQEYMKELHSIPDKKDNLRKELVKEEGKNLQLDEKINFMIKEQGVREVIRDAWETYFSSLVKLGENDTLRRIAEEYLELARDYLVGKEDLKNLRTRSEKELLNEFYKSRQAIAQYSPILDECTSNIEDNLVIPSELEELNLDTEWGNLISLRKYKLALEIQVNGIVKRREPRYVLSVLKERMDLQRANLNERDKRMYEEILLGSIGRTIKRKIVQTKDWVKNLNEIMMNINTGGGLQFGIKWMPLKATTEEELNTREIVRLLDIDAPLLKPEDREKLIDHFRSKIETRKLEQGLGQYTGLDLKETFKEILDYRKWFKFQLVSKYVNEGEFTLVDQDKFGKFSGGGRALALYIPILAAISSCYGEAHYDSPRIISMDEVWAGIDNKNINEMYKLLEELEFDFISNSQFVSGCSPALKGLSIYELIRPKNSKEINFGRYIWNGRYKEYVKNNLLSEDYPGSANM
ncbi:TIGR02680 family protein [Bacillus mycoides]|uniref:TIGR02680 family protein n=1 Tax=Bacillus mycoides TaxID=1405 RepID=UPI000BF0F6E6|nr:TIGR02680 family protein [Bacillus mycoides]PEK93301.1 TIGR02680 family protein [Bacillus mycoides]